MLLAFRMHCKDVIVATLTKLLSKSPVTIVTYSLCKQLQFLNPAFIVENSNTVTKFLKNALIATEQCQLGLTDEILESYELFCNSAKSKDSFIIYDKSISRIDLLIFTEKASDPKYEHLWQFVKKHLVISHGQATVERGFSENKEVLETNMKQQTLIARRIIKDHIKSTGGISNAALCPK